MRKNIIDVSEWQGDINFEEAKKEIDGVIIRVGYGKGHPDAWGVANLQKAIAAGLQYIGVYWFSYATNRAEARKEAEYCLEQIRGFEDKINLGVYFDFEEDSIAWMENCHVEPEKDLITGIFEAFCGRISEEGLDAGYYANYSNYRAYLSPEKLRAYRFWFAWWTEEDLPDIDDIFLHQYDSEGRIKGISGAVDLNEMEADGSPIDQYITVKDVVRGIWRGDFGNGEARKENLYNYFQKLVNEGRPEEC